MGGAGGGAARGGHPGGGPGNRRGTGGAIGGVIGNQTGSTTHPGGSVSGAPGRNAAMVVLKDLGTSLEEVVSRA